MKTAELFSERPREVAIAVQNLSAAEAAERGAVFTRREVVDFMLDLAQYTADQNLAESCLLDPSSGQGEFLLAASERLLQSFLDRGGVPETAADHLADALCAVELHQASFEQTRQRLTKLLVDGGLPIEASRSTVNKPSRHFPEDPVFEKASYARRYEILCQRLMREGLYDAAALILSPADKGAQGLYAERSEETGLKQLVAGFASHIAAASV